ncbi:MAG: ATP-binding protein, partial [Pseudomonadota bacterium]
EKLDVLIGQLLTLSRLDSGSGDVEKLELGDLVSAVFDDVCFEFPDLDIELSCAAGIFVDGYPHALRSAIENVLRNAALHGRENVQLKLTAESASALIVVSDEGGGVPDGALKCLFDAFYRVAGDSAGTGLGLAIAARAIAMHSGTITARNDEKGLIVEMRLPLGREPLPAA